MIDKDKRNEKNKKSRPDTNEVKKNQVKRDKSEQNMPTKSGTKKERPERNKPMMSRSEKERTEQNKPTKSGTKKERPERNKPMTSRAKKDKSPACPYEKKCGGCSKINIPYAESLAEKQQFVGKCLAKVMSGKKLNIEPIVGCENPLYYRNKVHSVFGRDMHGKIIRGIYKEESHQLVSVSGCLLENQTADAIIEEIKSLLPSFKLKVYDEDTGYGFLRHVLVRVGNKGGLENIMVVLVTSEVMFPGKNNFITALRKKFPQITTIIQNINNKKTSMVLGERNITIFGTGYIEDDSLGLNFRISPSAFFQINPLQTKKLYSLALEMAALTGSQNVLDAYCGTGTIGMFMASKAAKVTGVELNREAIRDAVSNMRGNSINNMNFVNDDATHYMQLLAADPDCPQIDVLCMDPPRSGSTAEFIKAAADLNIPRIVYVSCNPVTLARDVAGFMKYGYSLSRAVPVDMFPQTEHVEVVALLQLSNRKPDAKVIIDIDLEDYYAIKRKKEIDKRD